MSGLVLRHADYTASVHALPSGHLPAVAVFVAVQQVDGVRMLGQEMRMLAQPGNYLFGAQGLGTEQLRVQVQRRGVVHCGQVVTMDRFADARTPEWFKVKTDDAQGWYPGNLVRLCSGLDGRCSCVSADGATAE